MMIAIVVQVLKTDKDKEEAKHEEEMAEMMEKHSKEMTDLGQYYKRFYTFLSYKRKCGQYIEFLTVHFTIYLEN